jgi:hypothetical protein
LTALFIDRLIDLARRAREAPRTEQAWPVSPFLPASWTLTQTRTFSQDFLPFGSLLFLEATAALSATPANPAPVQAILRAKTSSRTLTFVNAHYVPDSIQSALSQPYPPSPIPHPSSLTLLLSSLVSRRHLHSVASHFIPKFVLNAPQGPDEQTTLLDKLL